VPSPTTTIGVISDTHGLLRPEALDALRGSDLLLHAGDIGSPDILPALATVAPVIAVRGNIDTDDWCQSIPETLVVEVGNAKLSLTHDRSKLTLDPVQEGCAAVIFGHSHKPHNALVHGVLWFNPGSAGPRRFRLPIAVGKLHVTQNKITGELLTLIR
jgi:uncharacterized protein